MFPLPDDVFLLIFNHLPLADVLRLRQVCSSFDDLTRTRSLWLGFLQRCVVRRNYPVPGMSGRRLQELDAGDIEQGVYNALRLRRVWTSPTPTPLRRLTMMAGDGHASWQVVGLHFLPGRGHRYLLTIATKTDARRRVFCFKCWDLEGSVEPRCIAFSLMPDVHSFSVNNEPQYPAIMAVQTSKLDIVNINFDAQDHRRAFQTLSSHPSSAHVRAFSGPIVITENPDHSLSVRDLRYPTKVLGIRNPAAETFHTAVIHPLFIIVIWTKTLQFYGLPKWDAIPAGRTLLVPLNQHQWRWPIDSVCSSFHASQYSSGPTPVNILIRFNSFLPWPVNLIHHHVLQPNPTFLLHAPISARNMPYIFPPAATHSIASPVRLFAATDMALGAFGTAVWTDNFTEDWLGPSNTGQRIAGLVLPTARPHPDHVHGGESEEPSVAASTNFDLQREERWVKVAVDDLEGRLAAGTAAGHVFMFEYA
ncbi:hypothetical protein FISHEDRAFT_44055 [Fistulina hepatica ATCC 64428]|uniref:F-box domain-containing protein n=1 Tax=Fistulina hepatica ATCC 64428 TaxID=1128425 RepID=A0A0D7AAK0_9AGAR|nr:hypothetical protein FISHEDRAFT_44055 [Fistulina hepatica ATCC 64428]